MIVNRDSILGTVSTDVEAASSSPGRQIVVRQVHTLQLLTWPYGTVAMPIVLAVFPR
jgi:hypothetical protein